MKGVIVVRVQKCVGCGSCRLACAVEHSDSKNLDGALREEVPAHARVDLVSAGAFTVPVQCRQCADAPCITVCSRQALHRADAESPVLLDQDRCGGCRMCVVVCPFGCIELDPARKKAFKCDQCFERLERTEKPACVTACPTGALTFRVLEEAGAGGKRASLVEIERSQAADRP